MTARRFTTLLLPVLAALPGCAAQVARTGAAPIDVGILAINDFHGNLQPPHLAITAPDGTTPVPAGGAAYLASAIASLRRAHPNAITVSAGDMTGASPLPSSIFLDEPTIATMIATVPIRTTVPMGISCAWGRRKPLHSCIDYLRRMHKSAGGRMTEGFSIGVLADRTGRPWLIDPAAYGGHREVDLAMLALFGRVPARTLAAYEEVSPLADGWRDRVELWQLFPLLVHAVLFGGGYLARSADLARRLSLF